MGAVQVPAGGRSLKVLTAEVAALHAQVCRMEVLIASWYAGEGLPVPEGLPVLPRPQAAGEAKRRRHAV